MTKSKVGSDTNEIKNIFLINHKKFLNNANKNDYTHEIIKIIKRNLINFSNVLIFTDRHDLIANKWIFNKFSGKIAFGARPKIDLIKRLKHTMNIKNI